MISPHWPARILSLAVGGLALSMVEYAMDTCSQDPMPLVVVAILFLVSGHFSRQADRIWAAGANARAEKAVAKWAAQQAAQAPRYHPT